MGFSRQEYWSGLPFPSPVDHILLDLSTTPILGCPVGMAWFHWVRQGCGPSVIRLTSFLWVWFQYVCPLMPSCNTYHLTWVSLTLGMGCLFMAAPAKHSHCSLPWTRGIIYDLYYDEEFVIYDLYYVEVGSLSIHFLECFIINGYWILSKNFFCIYWDDHMVLSFNLLIWCIALINLHILKNVCIPRVNATWLWSIIVLMCFRILFVRIWGLCLSKMLACNFPVQVLWYLCLFFMLGWHCWMNLGVFLHLWYFLDEFEKNRC